MKEHRGSHRKRLGDKNRVRVFMWMIENPAGMVKECCEKLKLSYVTVAKHMKCIREDNELFKRLGAIETGDDLWYIESRWVK